MKCNIPKCLCAIFDDQIIYDLLECNVKVGYMVEQTHHSLYMLLYLAWYRSSPKGSSHIKVSDIKCVVQHDHDVMICTSYVISKVPQEPQKAQYDITW